MNVFVMNSEIQAIAVIDIFSSFIWTDRYREAGDFELYLPMSTEILSQLMGDYYLSITNSDRLMLIEKITISTDTEEGSFLTVEGSSLESILKRRILYEQYTLSGSLEDAIATLLYYNVINPEDPLRKIDNFVFVASDDSRIEALTVDAQYAMGDNLYDIVVEVCKNADVGFKITLNDTTKIFEFRLYKGLDRSYEQSENPYVIFSPDFDNLTNSSYVESYSEYKNVVLVSGDTVNDVVTTVEVGDFETSGLARREAYEAASDVSRTDDNGKTITDTEYNNLLIQKGNDTLTELLYSVNMDCELEHDGVFTYPDSFDMGDIVQVENEWGIQTRSCIEEMIISQDETGVSMYPTFKVIEDEEGETK